MLPRAVRFAALFLGVSAIAASVGASAQGKITAQGRGCAGSPTGSTACHGPTGGAALPWPAPRRLRPWRGRPRRRSVLLPRRSIQPWRRV